MSVRGDGHDPAAAYPVEAYGTGPRIPAGRPSDGPAHGRRGRRRRWPRVVLACAAVLATVVALGGAWVYLHLSGNITALPLSSGVAGSAGTERADAFGNTPLNVLVLGSDARSNAADCRLGGGCGHASSDRSGGRNADVEMLVHLAADRSNATVISIPRDVVTTLPECTDPSSHRSVASHQGMINSALTYGPGCQVAAVHQLTGIPIDHFVMVDFSGVVTMADAVGGVRVCVSDDVYDNYSHLKLGKGSHVLTGQAALEFVRSRHAFGDGSDLGRTYAQHLYLASLIRTLKSAGTLADPVTVYSLADAATRALTVDTGLGSIPRLVALAADLDKVPANRTTFTTMQTAPDPVDHNRLVAGPGARALFDAVTHDQSLASARPAGGSSPSAGGTAVSPSPPVDRAAVDVRVLNGIGVPRRAAAVVRLLAEAGFTGAHAGTARRPSPASTLEYGPGHQAEARAVAAAVGLPSSRMRASATATHLTLVVGADWTGGTRYPGGTPAGESGQAVDTTEALQGAHGQTADVAATCAPVSHEPTVQVDRRIMNPVQAYSYASARGVPDSAR